MTSFLRLCLLAIVAAVLGLAGCGTPPATDETDPLPKVFGNKDVDPSKMAGRGPGSGGGMGRGAGGRQHGSGEGMGTGGGSMDASGGGERKANVKSKAGKSAEDPQQKEGSETRQP